MKKIVILAFITMTLFTLVACNADNETTSNTSILNYTSSDIKSKSLETKIQSSEIPKDGVRVVKESNLSPTFPHPLDAVTFGITDTYYNEAGEIVVEGYLVNISEYPAGQIRLAKLELFNENDELLASNAFGYLPYGTSIKPGNAMAYTCTFPVINIFITDDDLDTVKPVSKFR